MTSDEFLKLYKAIDAESINEHEIQSKFHKLMEKKSLEEIPGAIPINKEQLRLQELFERGTLLANYMKASKFTKKEMIFLLSVVVKALGISLEDNS